MGINLLVFGLQIAIPGFDAMFALTPTNALSGEIWQFITYMFLHGGAMHIMLNMFVLGIFGPLVEKQLGWRKFLLLYVLSGLGSAFLYIVLTGISSVSMLGASGAVFGVLAAYGYLFPKNIILVFFVPMPALLAVVVIIAFELIAGIFNFLPGIANFGHVGGALTGLVFMYLWKMRLRSVPIAEKATRTYEFFWE